MENINLKRYYCIFLLITNELTYLKVFVKKYLREEIKFEGLEELIKQIDQDKIESLKVL